MQLVIPQCTCFVELNAECSRLLATLRKRKATKSMYKRSQEGKKRTRESAKRKKHVVESLHKPGINYAHFHVPSNCSRFCACAARGTMHMHTPSISDKSIPGASSRGNYLPGVIRRKMYIFMWILNRSALSE